jgi:dolichyl-phosphate-mannose--protein O-mannosyl transferase
MLVLSSFAHTLLGWPEMQRQLKQTAAPPDLLLGMKLGWYFGGAAILIFGIIVLYTFVERVRGRMVSTTQTAIFSVGYFLFGCWALAASHDPFFFVFIIPAVLTAIGSFGRSPA